MSVAFYCEKFNVTPDQFGLDIEDPRLCRNMQMALNVYEVATDRQRAKKDAIKARRQASKTKGGSKIEIPVWEHENPDAVRLLRWAEGESKTLDADPRTVRFEVPAMKD